MSPVRQPRNIGSASRQEPVAVCVYSGTVKAWRFPVMRPTPRSWLVTGRHLLRSRSRTDVRGGRRPPRAFDETFGSLRQADGGAVAGREIVNTPVVVTEPNW